MEVIIEFPSERFNAAVTPELAIGYAVTLQWLKILAHALPQTWGKPWSLRQRNASEFWSYDGLAEGRLYHAHRQGRKEMWQISKGIKTGKAVP